MCTKKSNNVLIQASTDMALHLTDIILAFFLNSLNNNCLVGQMSCQITRQKRRRKSVSVYKYDKSSKLSDTGTYEEPTLKKISFEFPMQD